MPFFRKRPLVIEAFQLPELDENPTPELVDFLNKMNQEWLMDDGTVAIFSGTGQWDAYLKWNWTVPCQGCGRRHMDYAPQYGLQQLGHWPDGWVTEDWCEDCFWEAHK